MMLSKNKGCADIKYVTMKHPRKSIISLPTQLSYVNVLRLNLLKNPHIGNEIVKNLRYQKKSRYYHTVLTDIGQHG